MHQELSASLRDARRCHNAIAIALAVGDPTAALVAATRLRAALHTARTEATDGDTERSIDRFAREVEELLSRAPTRLESRSDVQRLLVWLDIIETNRQSGYGPDLVAIEAVGGRLDRTVWTDLRVVDANLAEASLVGSIFRECDLASSNLERANATRTNWRGARVTHSRLAGALLADAVFDSATFEDCDLRGAHFGTELPRTSVPVLGTTFVRCDLRETSWSGRFVGGAKLIECKVFGMHGAAVVDGVEIVAADRSALADGSEPATAGDVIRVWRS